MYVSYPDNIDGVLGAIQKWQYRLGTAYHCFAGVNLRSSRNGREQDLESIHSFGIDVDISKRRAVRTIFDFQYEPTMVINSGSGFHVYFRLNTPFTLADQQDLIRAKKVSKGLHKALVGDSTHDLSRVLRIPGTYNVKHPANSKYCSPYQQHWTKCSIRSISDKSYPFDQLERAVPSVSIEEAESMEYEPNGEVDADEIVSEIPRRIKWRAKNIPYSMKTDRSRNDFWIACELFKEDFSEQEVYKAFQAFAQKDWEASSKFTEIGEEYLTEHTIPNAKKAVLNEA